MRVVLVVNPAAGGTVERTEELEAGLAVVGPVAVVAPASADSFAAELRRAAAGAGVIAVAGGDGTLNMAVNALADRLGEVAFALVPTGTGNDLARTLEVPRDPAEAARVVAAGRERLLDLGVARGPGVERFFVNACMGGFPVQVDEAIDEDTKRRFGAAAFWIGGARAVTDLRRSRVEVNGLEVRDCLAVGVGNGRTCGGGIEVWPDAEPDDGVLELCALPASNLAAAARLAVGVRSGNHRQIEDVVSLSGSEFEISSDPPIEINVDGELIGLRTPAQFAIAGKIRLMTS